MRTTATTQDKLSAPAGAGEIALATEGFRYDPRLLIPEDEEGEFFALPTGVRNEINLWREALTRHFGAAHGTKKAEGERIWRDLGIEPKRLSAMLTKWKKAGRSWRALFDRRQLKSSRTGSNSPEFKEAVRKVFLRSNLDNGGVTAAWGHFKGLWRAWLRDPANADLRIPGYSEPPPPDPFNHDYPTGWSYRTFARICEAITPAERVLATQGPKAAHLKHGAIIHRTRVGLQVGEYVYMDDGVLDNKCTYLGVCREPVRPLYLLAADALTANVPLTICKPELVEEVEGGHRTKKKTVRRGLTEVEAYWFTMRYLCEVGYNPDTGTTLVPEHGTMCIKFADKLAEFGPKDRDGRPLVRVEVSGLYNTNKFQRLLFGGKVGGNPRYKALAEQWNAHLRTRGALLPGYTGANSRLSKPEQLSGNEAFDRELIRLAERNELDGETVAKLAFEHPDWSAMSRLITLVFDAIRTDSGHKLEGWIESGFVKPQFRIADQGEHADHWLDDTEYSRLSPEWRERMRLRIEDDPKRWTRQHRLSRAEAWAKTSGKLARMNRDDVYKFAPPAAWRTARVQSGALEIHLRDAWIAPGRTMRFHAVGRDPRGTTVHLDRGQTYKVLVDVFNPDRLWVAYEDGGFIGHFAAVPVSLPGDKDGIIAQLGTAAGMDAGDVARLTNLTRDEIAERWDRRKAAKARASDPRTDEQIEADAAHDRAASEAGRAVDPADFIDPATGASKTTPEAAAAAIEEFLD